MMVCGNKALKNAFSLTFYSVVANRLRHPGSTYSAPPVFAKKADSTYGGSRVLRVTDDLKGRHPQKPRTQSEAGFGSRPGSKHGTLTRK